MTISPRSWLAVPFAVLLIFAGCSSSGGDEDSAPTTTAAEVDDSTTTTAGGDETTTTSAGAETTTTTSGASSPGGGGDHDEICGLLRQISDYDAEASAVVAGSDWSAVQEFYVSTADRVVGVYDEAIALDTDLSADLETLKAVAERTGPLAAESSNLDEYATALIADPSIDAATEPALRVNAFAETTCGFSTGGN